MNGMTVRHTLTSSYVIPAQAGIQAMTSRPDAGFHRYDE